MSEDVFIDMLEDDEGEENQHAGRLLAKRQPCGCIICTCDHPTQCQGCGAQNCGTHPVGAIPNPVYEDTGTKDRAAMEQLANERDRLAERVAVLDGILATVTAERDQLRLDVAELTGWLRERTDAMLERQVELRDEARQVRRQRDNLVACLQHLRGRDWFQAGTTGDVVCILDADRVRDALNSIDASPTAAKCGQSTPSADNPRTEEPTCTGCGHPRSRVIKAVIEGCIACCPDCDVLKTYERNFIREVVAVAELQAMRDALNEAHAALAMSLESMCAVRIEQEWDCRSAIRAASAKLQAFIGTAPAPATEGGAA